MLGKVVVPKTHEDCGAGLLCFNEYCDSINLQEKGHMLASELLLALFIANCEAGEVAGSTVDKWLAIINCGHQITDTPWFGGHLLSQTNKGATRLAPAMSQ